MFNNERRKKITGREKDLYWVKITSIIYLQKELFKKSSPEDIFLWILKREDERVRYVNTSKWEKNINCWHSVRAPTAHMTQVYALTGSQMCKLLVYRRTLQLKEAPSQDRTYFWRHKYKVLRDSKQINIKKNQLVWII